MDPAQILCVEIPALMAFSDLEQLEGPWMELMHSKDPESVAVAFRLVLVNLTQTRSDCRCQMSDVRCQMSDVMHAAEEKINLQGTAAYSR